MAQTKRRTPAAKKIKRSALKIPSRKPRKVIESSVWRSEIQLLQSKVFSSVDQALDQLIEGVVNRLGSAGPKAAAEREFVRLLLETDPGLIAALRKALRIK